MRSAKPTLRSKVLTGLRIPFGKRICFPNPSATQKLLCLQSERAVIFESCFYDYLSFMLYFFNLLTTVGWLTLRYFAISLVVLQWHAASLYAASSELTAELSSVLKAKS